MVLVMKFIIQGQSRSECTKKITLETGRFYVSVAQGLQIPQCVLIDIFVTCF